MILSSTAKDFLDNEAKILFHDIYITDALIKKQQERYLSAIKAFEQNFGEKHISIYNAPGRSEICGNHTDHQHGTVLAASINLDTLAITAPREDGVIEILSEGYPKLQLTTDNLSMVEEEKGTTASLVKGILNRLQELGYHIGGFSAYITSDVPAGAGLSSSAAFEVVIGTIISGLYNHMEIDSVTIAQVSQYAENVYFGKPCGLMDQMACSYGGLIHIDFENPENPLVTRARSNFNHLPYSLCIVNTRGSHADLTDDYAQIPKDMKAIANYFNADFLRQVNPTNFFAEIPKLRKACDDRAILRAFHFFDEQQRVEMANKALEKTDFNYFLNYVRQSGLSSFQYLQNVYSPNDPTHQSISIALATSEHILKNHGVCRVHGGGFAGTIQAFVEDDFVSTYQEEMDRIFGDGSCYVLKIRPSGGIQVV